MKKPFLPPDVLKRAKELVTKTGIPFKTAAEVAQGTKTLANAIEELRLRDAVLKLKEKGALDGATAGLVLTGSLSLQEALFKIKTLKRKREKDYQKCHMDEHAAAKVPICVAMVGHRVLSGTIERNERFDIDLRLQEGESVVVRKHDVKFYFPAAERKAVLKSVDWGDKSVTLEADHLKDPRKRVDIKAKVYLEAMDAGKTMEWKTVEGEKVRGRITWMGRYEVVLALAKGSTVVMMRHAVKGLE